MTLSDFLPKLHYPTRLEKLADGWVHGIGLGVFSLAVIVALGLGIWKGGLGMGAAIAIYAVSVVTSYSYLAEASEAISPGDYVKPAADGSGRAAVGTATANCARAVGSAAAAGQLVEVRITAHRNA